METAMLAGGCFWCTEAIFKRLKGVSTVVSGYTGGSVPNPKYNDVCSGTTGHAEAIRITFDPSVLPYKNLLEIFFHLHDPTTKNQQGNDVGTQYRSAIFYTTPKQERIARELIDVLSLGNTYRNPIVTEVVKAGEFYEAEDYHKDYYAKNSYQPYCQYVIDPKLQKLLAQHRDSLKEEYRIG